MLGNVWLRIAPALRRGAVDLHGSRGNARLSLPVLLVMASSHQPSLVGPEPWLATLGTLLGLGYVLGWWVERALP